MALLPKKTYSRRNYELSILNEQEKENVDPFDKLLSSPPKQEVQFQPLSFWGEKVKCFGSKEKSRKVECRLFEASDSDEYNSPFQRKRKPKAKSTVSKARTLQPKSNLKLSVRRKNYSSVNSYNSKSNNLKPSVPDKNSGVPTKGIEKSRSWLLDDILWQNNTTDKTLNSPTININHFKFTNSKRNFNEINNNSKVQFKRILSPINSTENPQKNLNNTQNEINFINHDNRSFKKYEDDSESLILSAENDNTIMPTTGEDSLNNIILSENLFQSGHDNFKFVSKRRHFNYPNCMTAHNETLESSSSLVVLKPKVSSQSQSEQLINSSDSRFESFCMSEEFLEEIGDERLSFYNYSSIENSLYCNESIDETFYMNSFFDKEHEEISLQEYQGKITGFDFSFLSETELEDTVVELHNANPLDDVVESSLTSDDTLSSFNEEDTVVKVELKLSSVTDSDAQQKITNSDSNAVSHLTTQISDLSLSNVVGDKSFESETNELKNLQHTSNYEDDEKKFLVNLENVTTKRRGFLNDRYEKNVFNRLSSISSIEVQNEEKVDEEKELDQSLWINGGTTLDWNKTICLANPVFESTRVFDTGPTDLKMQSDRLECTENISEETLPGFDRTLSLKPGKKWFRSISVLKQLQNGSFAGDKFESTRITGRKFGSFVKDMMDVHNGFFSAPVYSTAAFNISKEEKINNTRFFKSDLSKTGLELENFLEDVPEKHNTDDSTFSKSFSNHTLSEKSFLSRTVKVIESEEGSSAFRSALGLDIGCSLLKKSSVKEESSAISARDFILMQCGQEDVLPFEEYFNEKTLKNCRKIGEGVYGEVFMSSDAVIKIIPIEGSDKVNGEPQKSFEEIISEVIIASKLSNLRKGKKERTDGFSEMKRCWCVKGKYPKYLLKLWNEYDQLGSGSENDSPVMFKDDQLYIILELANGGKDLESFVFASSAQSLSIFIQTAYSLAVAEKAFEFEHRDLHWGNVLISETKEKFVTFCLDGVEYEVPTKGVKVCIIDFTLSRINHEGCCIFNDLSVDPSLFASEGDYQFEIYRLMLREVKNDWSLFKPKTNIFWLHYTLDKMIKLVRYKNKKTKVHIKYLKYLKTLEGTILEYNDSVDFLLSESFNDVINKL